MFRFLASIFKLKGTLLDEKDAMKKFLVVGLGNIGEEYVETRHNIGFKILDSLSVEEDFSFETAKLGDVGTFKVKGKSIICLKPSTYMNRSGKALKYWMDKENIPLENVLIITDDINLSFGTIRLKTKGSDGGHNGLKDVQQYLLTTNYNRLRFGVGSDFGKGKQIDYVLGEWNQEEKEALTERFARVNALIRSFVLSGVNRTMNEYNGT
ncbi:MULTISPECIES: aminoacyl-tRNA hydrolase [unclassified Arenibacter]|uniref:aminoacyl-tRNA hydrolase n=1 Tax=unclassified Arenibacter TaxID=2615047 RepID=UPI000E34FF01|nr:MULTISPECIES: aminoacyl-tRNA hydrolase [unclassified Arenibacter]MCM4162342.1 aminoacyl-tRNA hydrolase [Arenibacter sp. A80]RFT57940.1 aminoacyl-tRNA hydrolase [Arenibacter sp. P308M17]